MKAIMYHYVRPEIDSPPFGYFYLSLTSFRQQLDYFETEHNILSREQFFSTVMGSRKPQSSDILLTFDDALRDHHEYVYPELRERGLWGIFYVPAGPYLHGNVLDVHRTHAAIGKVGGEAVCTAIEDIVDDSMIAREYLDRFRTTYDDQNNPDGIKRTKQYLNYFIKDRYRSDVLDRVEQRLLESRLKPDRYYMSQGALAKIASDDFLVGAHSVSHRALSQLSTERQRQEILESLAFIERSVDSEQPRTFCYPYGGKETYTDETLRLLNAAGCRFCFAVESTEITDEILEKRRQSLPRYDCNQFPHGEASADIGP